MQNPVGARPPDSIAQGEVTPRFGEVLIRDRGRLPHWEKEEGLYFITFHLAGSLPEAVLEGMVERQKILNDAKRTGAHLLPSQQVFITKYSPKR
jgi:hypothetical protein